MRTAIVALLVGCGGADDATAEREPDLVGRWLVAFDMATLTDDDGCELGPREYDREGTVASALDVYATADELLLVFSDAVLGRSQLVADRDEDSATAVAENTRSYGSDTRYVERTEVVAARDGDAISGTVSTIDEQLDGDGTSVDRCQASLSFAGLRFSGGAEVDVEDPSGPWLFRTEAQSVSTGVTCEPSSLVVGGQDPSLAELMVVGEAAGLCWEADCYYGTLDGSALEVGWSSSATEPESGHVASQSRTVRLDLSTGAGEFQSSSYAGDPDDPDPPETDCTSTNAIEATRIVAAPAL